MTRRVNLDMDLHRVQASAFGPSSLVDGGLLPYEGRQELSLPDGLPSAVLEAEEDGWLSPNNPILVRGLVKILPLAWRGEPKSGNGVGAKPEEIAAIASKMQAAGMYWAGNWSVLDLADSQADNIGPYTAALRTAGATRVNCWRYSEAVGLALVWADGRGQRSSHCTWLGSAIPRVGCSQASRRRSSPRGCRGHHRCQRPACSSLPTGPPRAPRRRAAAHTS